MPRDNRVVVRGISVTDPKGKRMVLTDVDQISQLLSQEELDSMVKRGLLEGDWKSEETIRREREETYRRPTEPNQNAGSSSQGVGSLSSGQTAEQSTGQPKEANGLPEDFPMRHVFDALGFKSVAQVQALSKDELVALNGIGETTAEKALKYGK